MEEDVQQRFDLVDDRLEHLEHRAETLEDKHSDQAARRREWLVIGLFVLEVALGLMEVWAFMGPKHA